MVMSRWRGRRRRTFGRRPSNRARRRIVGKLLEAPPFVGRDCDLPHRPCVLPVAGNPLEEDICGPPLSRLRAVASIFGQNLTGAVEYDTTLSSGAIEFADAGRHASRARLLRCAVCYAEYVGVDDEFLGHSPAARLRSMPARVIAAISPNSSPKKSVGQFAMLPYGSRSSSVDGGVGTACFRKSTEQRHRSPDHFLGNLSAEDELASARYGFRQ